MIFFFINFLSQEIQNTAADKYMYYILNFVSRFENGNRTILLIIYNLIHVLKIELIPFSIWQSSRSMPQHWT